MRIPAVQGTGHQDPAVPAVEVPVVIPAGVPVAREAVVVPAAQAPAAGGPADPARVAVVPAAANKNKTAGGTNGDKMTLSPACIKKYTSVHNFELESILP